MKLVHRPYAHPSMRGKAEPSVTTVLDILGPRVEVDASGCWLWRGTVHRTGYGVLSVNYKQVRAPRYVYALANGAIAAGLVVCHRCDVPLCVNPDHLFLGTVRDNALDAKAKGRLAYGHRNGAYTKPERVNRGETHGRAKLTVADVDAIRDSYAAGGVTMAELGRRYGITKGHIHRIIHAVAWGTRG